MLGPTLFHIPLEELFFFVIQTYGVSLLYMIISKPTFHPVHLPHTNSLRSKTFVEKFGRIIGIVGQLFLIGSILKGALLIRNGGLGTYLGLIVVWAFPFLLLLW